MPVKFTAEAFADLNELDAYLAEKSPQGLRHVTAALKAVFLQIEAHPRIGRPTQDESLRVTVEPRYGFIIPYFLATDGIWIVRVYNARRAPLDFSTLKLP
jgi:toxin ParE1/3/4